MRTSVTDVVYAKSGKQIPLHHTVITIPGQTRD